MRPDDVAADDEPRPERTDNSVKPEDGEQDVPQTPDPVVGDADDEFEPDDAGEVAP